MPGLSDPIVLATGVGVLLGLGILLLVVGFLPRTARLSDVFGVLDAAPTSSSAPTLVDADPDTGWDTRLGRFGYTRLHVPVGAATLRRLELRGRTISDFVAEKLLLAIFGLVVPQLYQMVRLVLGRGLSAVPVGAGLLLMVAGFFWPDLSLRRDQDDARDDARQAVLSFFDLVTLERLANQSAIASLHAAASMSDSIMFTKVRGALDRARLEQRPPWSDLERLADEMQLPEIRDLSDVLRLDEQGAALAGALRSRVHELRDAQLTREKVRAQAVSESMTLWMVIPSFVIGVLLIAPPLLRMSGLG